MFDEESKERLISIVEDAGFDFDYEEEPEQTKKLCSENVLFGIQLQAARFSLRMNIITPIENTIANNGVIWFASLELPNCDNLSDSEVLSLYKNLNNLNFKAGQLGICHLLYEGDSVFVITFGRTEFGCNSLSEVDAILVEINIKAFKECLEAVAEKFCG